MDITFRIAVGVSVIVHSALFAPFHQTAAERPDKKLVVDYVRLKGPEKKPSPQPKAAAPRSIETPKVQISQKVATSPSRPAGEKGEEAKKEARELAAKQAPLRTTKDYINYYQLIREKIRRQLKERYRSRHAEGDVTLLFMLNSDGSLAAIDVSDPQSLRDGSLAAIAVESVRSAAPFPPFPKELSAPKVSFDLTISFKRE